MISRKLLKRLTPAIIEQAIAERARLLKSERLAEKRRKLMTALALVDAEMAKLEGEPVRRRGPGRPPKAETEKRGRRKGYKLSAATRKKMRLAALRRYGKVKPETPKAEKRTRVFSPEAREKMAEAARRRWAKVKEAGAATT
jgi:hypothetical protein